MARVHATQIDTIIFVQEVKYIHLRKWVGKFPNKSYFSEQVVVGISHVWII